MREQTARIYQTTSLTSSTSRASLPRKIKKAGRRALLPAAPWRTFSSVAWFRDVGSLGTFWALNDLKFHRISFLQGTVSVADNGGIMYKYVRTIIAPEMLNAILTQSQSTSDLCQL